MYQHAKENNIKKVIKWRISARWGRLNYCCDFMTNFNRAEKINNLVAYAHVAFPAMADIPFTIHGLFADFSRPFARAKNAT